MWVGSETHVEEIVQNCSCVCLDKPSPNKQKCGMVSENYDKGKYK